MRAWLCAAALCATACDYTWGVRRPTGVRTLALELVDNQSDRRDLEWALTDALALELQSRGYTLVTAGAADATCHVRVREVVERTVAEDPVDAPLQGSITVVADVVLRDRSGRTVIDRRDLRETDTYLVPAGATEADATRRAARVLARRIADTLVPGF